MSIPLEDLFNDVVAKTMRGLGISDAALSVKTGVAESVIAGVKNGTADEAAILKIAPALGLHGPSLVTMVRQAWQPEPVNVEGLAQFNTVWHDMTVNSYLVWDVKTKAAVAFDTGADATGMKRVIEEKGLFLNLIFLTHTHTDHVADLQTLASAGENPRVFVNVHEPHPGATNFSIGDSTGWETGGLKIEPRSTWGHSKGGTTYVVTGLARPLAIVGDALFASSMGGGIVSFTDALSTNRKEIFTLPDETVICPGHGPLTTVGEEKARNPFYPEFK
jgi:hydroxyacylglutathione hydrolase